MLELKIHGKKMQNLQRLIFISLIIFSLPTSVFSQQWQFKASMPTARKGMAVAVLDNKIWVIGGRFTSHAALNVVEVYDPSTNSWDTQVPGLNTARENATAQVWNGMIYVFGGKDNHLIISSVERFNPTTNSWEDVSNMPTQRYGIASILVDSSIWIIGGTDINGSNYNSIEIFNLQNNNWSNLPASMNIARGDPMAVMINDNIHVFGGHYFGPVLSYEKYDSTTQSWSMVGNMIYSCGSAGYLSFDNQAMLIGGMSQSGVLDKVQIFQYDGGIPAWSEGPTLNTPRRELVSAVVNNKIYAIGGRGMMGMNIYDTVEELDMLVGLPQIDPKIPEDHAFISNYPNPFNNSTVVFLQLPERDEIRLKIYDVMGQEVGQIYQGKLLAGKHQFSIAIEQIAKYPLSTGIYFIRLEGRKFSYVKKINYIR
jgi:N-acetylneuraminic acid mutarotase